MKKNCKYVLTNNKTTDVPKLILNENNFARALNYMDLVCAYIHDKHSEDGYMLLPSSGKISRPNYEFTFVSGNPNKKTITCRVKNQEAIDAKKYAEDKDFYEKIYLFSAKGINNAAFAEDNIEIIGSSELFCTLSSGRLKFMRDKLAKYHIFRGDINLNEIENCLSDKGRRRVNRFTSSCRNYIAIKGGEMKLISAAAIFILPMNSIRLSSTASMKILKT